jgi:hypothetical protein
VWTREQDLMPTKVDRRFTKHVSQPTRRANARMLHILVTKNGHAGAIPLSRTEMAGNRNILAERQMVVARYGRLIPFSGTTAFRDPVRGTMPFRGPHDSDPGG